LPLVFWLWFGASVSIGNSDCSGAFLRLAAMIKSQFVTRRDFTAALLQRNLPAPC